MNTNGLVSCRDVSATGAVDSNFFIRKGQPIAVPSPFGIVSQDGTKTTTISVENSGDTIVESVSTIALDAGTGVTLFRSPDTSQFLEVSVYDGGQVNLTAPSLAVYSGSGATAFFAPDASSAFEVSVLDGGAASLSTAGGSLSINSGTGSTIFGSPDLSKSLEIAVLDSVGGVTLTASGGPLTLDSFTGVTNFLSPNNSQKFIVNVKDDASTSIVNNGGITMFTDNTVTISPNTQASGNGALRIQNGTTASPSANFTTYVGGATGPLSLTVGNLQTYGDTLGVTRKVMDLNPAGSLCTIGSQDTVGGTVLQVDGTLGVSRVYDAVYNIPPAPAGISIATVFTTGNTFAAGAFVSPSISVLAGVYQLQAIFELQNGSGYSLPVSGSINSFLQVSGVGGAYMKFSEFNCTVPMLVSPPLAGTSNSPTFVSGIFSVPSTASYFIGYDVDGTWNLGPSGNIEFQLVKLA